MCTEALFIIASNWKLIQMSAMVEWIKLKGSCPRNSLLTPRQTGTAGHPSCCHCRGDGLWSSKPDKLEGLINILGFPWELQKGHNLHVQNMFQNYRQNQNRPILTKHKTSSLQAQGDQFNCLVDQNLTLCRGRLNTIRVSIMTSTMSNMK